VVFLGSGSMLGIARECHLKLQELTDGQIICKFDSFLGFRHGPRAVTNEKTLLVYLFSPNDHVYKYEFDLASSIAKDSRNINCLTIGRPEEISLNSCLNLDLKLNPDQELNIVPATLIGQILGYYKSLQLGLDPDNPSISGAISRVVEGVTIYES
jgi:tagatose-6-phosphate ketose/aldose isomerase